MKERYRNMMEQAILSEQTKADLLEKLEQKRPARKGAPILRAALIAACACVVLVGGAFAATYIAGFSAFEKYEVGELIFKDVGKRGYSGYRLSGGMTPIPARTFSEKVQALPEGNTQVIFDSWEDAEQFLGVHLKGNPLLEEMGRTVYIDPRLGGNTHCILRVCVGEHGLQHVIGEAHYFEEGDDITSTALVSWQVLMTTENSDRKHAYEVIYPSEKELLVEEYTGAGGLEVLVVETRDPKSEPVWTFNSQQYRTVEYAGYFSLDGVACCVSIRGYCPLDYGENIPALELLKEIIDSYDVS